MKRLSLVLFAAALLWAPFFAGSEPHPDPHRLQQAIDRVVAKVAPAAVAVRDGRGTFSAVIISPQGYVLTAGHAVQPGSHYVVLLADGREFNAVGLGREPRLDLGLIQISEPQALPIAELGWSASLRKDQPCISLGHPGRMDAGRGAVVRFGRIADPVAANGMIQSTCLMEPGDSGGPLFDMQGRVIGIHSNIRESLQQNYEVPIDQFRRYWPQLLQAQTFRSADIDLGPDFGLELVAANRNRRDRGQGVGYGSPRAEVARIDSDSAAAQAGLQPGDRLLTINGQSARRLGEARILLQRACTLAVPTVAMTVLRGDRELELAMALPAGASALQQWSGSASVVERAPRAEPVAPVAGLDNLAAPLAALEARLDASALAVTSQLSGAAVGSMATLLAPGYLLIGKSSLVGGAPAVTTPAGVLRVAVIARDKGRDLVLMKLPQSLPGGVELSASGAARERLGRLLLSPHPATDGKVGVWGSRHFATGKRESSGYLGVMPRARRGKVVLWSVLPDGPAAGQFQDGDYLLAVNGVEVATPEALVDELANYDPGDRVRVAAERAGKPISVEIELGKRPAGGRHIAEYFAGGKSARRDGFPLVFSHDTDLRPAECGGPLYTADGEFVGINIARFSRTRSYAIPASELRQFVAASLATR